MDSLWQDLKFGARQLRRSPAFTLVAALTLSLGIGSTAAIFSVVDSLLLDTIPFEKPEELIYIGERSAQFPNMSVAYPNFQDWREQSRSFEYLAAHRDHSYNVTGLERPVQIHAVMTSAELFPMLGVDPLLGRTFTADEDQPGGPAVVVLSWGFWQRQLGGDPDAIGRTLSLDGDPYEVVGVMPQGFTYPLTAGNAALWQPIGHFAAERWLANRGNHPGMYVTGRMAPGVTVKQARQELEAVAHRLAEEYPDTNTGNSITLVSLQDHETRYTRPALLMLAAAVGLVLLIACANVANLLLARAAARGQEIALRSALGAGRRRLARQLLTESVLLALLGGVLGVGVAYGAVEAAASTFDISALPSHLELGLDTTVLGFTLLVATFSGLLFGLVPAIHVARGGLDTRLRDGGRTAGGRGQRLRATLVVLEVALALVLVVGAALFVSSFRRLITADPGFEPRDVLSFELVLSEAEYPERAQQANAYTRLVERIEALPGVLSAANTLPLLGGWQSGISVEGQPPPAPGEQISTEVLRVAPSIFETLGLRLIRGRLLDERDRADSVRVAVIDEVFADRIWPGQDPLGRRFLFGTPAPVESDAEADDPARPAADGNEWIEVVGVVNHVKSYGVHQSSRMQAYLPSQQDTRPFTTFVVRTTGNPEGLIRAIENEVLAFDPNLPIANAVSLEQRLGRRIEPQRAAASMLSVFAGLALLLATLGIYGVMTYSVSQRRQEIGVRMALGASAPAVVRMVVGQAMRLALTGIGIGLISTVLLAPLVGSQLFEVSPRDPSTLLYVPLVLAAVALSAAAVPARRATRVDPLVALRHD